jgi:hypothetical protein
MVYGIIPWRRSENNGCGAGKAHADPLIGMSWDCMRLFCVAGLPARASFRRQKQ